ncbi:hypothetical protein EB796_020025 [Bugula neritina]|uniref:Uncharacterized protein n=1 Tax=Bugula neritina TaxID=10212 RepID=A0A7J7J6L2_BUGNE|nr:hypothetical protein EB796_020025 [Bugula neritina]
MTTSNFKVVTGVMEHHQNTYILHRVNVTCKLEVCLTDDISKRKEIFQFERTGTIAPMMAISEKYVIVNDLDSKQLIAYDFVTKSTVIIYPYIALLGVHFVTDSQFLAVGEDKLIKYRIEEAMIVPVWICENINSGYGICTDSHGVIYVVTRNNEQLIHVISPAGI